MFLWSFLWGDRTINEGICESALPIDFILGGCFAEEPWKRKALVSVCRKKNQTTLILTVATVF